jgi:hypothetical protein
MEGPQKTKNRPTYRPSYSSLGPISEGVLSQQTMAIPAYLYRSNEFSVNGSQGTFWEMRATQKQTLFVTE